jgi:hypothetical protein
MFYTFMRANSSGTWQVFSLTKAVLMAAVAFTKCIASAGPLLLLVVLYCVALCACGEYIPSWMQLHACHVRHVKSVSPVRHLPVITADAAVGLP